MCEARVESLQVYFQAVLVFDKLMSRPPPVFSNNGTFWNTARTHSRSVAFQSFAFACLLCSGNINELFVERLFRGGFVSEVNRYCIEQCVAEIHNLPRGVVALTNPANFLAPLFGMFTGYWIKHLLWCNTLSTLFVVSLGE